MGSDMNKDVPIVIGIWLTIAVLLTFLIDKIEKLNV